MTRTAIAWGGLAACALLAGCSSTGSGDGATDGGLEPRLGGHIGPAVASAQAGSGTPSGPARFIQPLLGIYEPAAAMAVALEMDGYYRSPASEGYEKAMGSMLAGLYGAGFGAEDGYELKIIKEAMATPAWTPISAEINVVGIRDGEVFARAPIAAFNKPADEFRLLLAEGAPSCRVQGPAVYRVEDITPGTILVTDRSVRNVELEAVEKGAIAIVSWFQLPYCDDPTGQDRQIDAIFHGKVRLGSTVPSFYVSPRMADVMEHASKQGSIFELVGSVRTEVRELRTVVATIRGSERPDESVYVVSAVSGVGANDNAAGAAGIMEGVRALKRLIATGQVQRPSRTLHFVFGKEAEAGGTALKAMDDTPVAGVVADMISASYAKTGAICLLERGWDPGAIVSLPPDAHTPWGAGSLAEEDILPNGLSIVLRQALVDVGLAIATESGVPWSTREHPWEGGSDHDTFLGRGIPAALVWHFTDFAYSTSLDRMEHVDKEELRRTSVAIVAAAAAIADARPLDLQRYLDSLAIERDLRLQAASAAGARSGLREIWIDWFLGAEQWLGALTEGRELPEFDGLRALDSFGPNE